MKLLLYLPTDVLAVGPNSNNHTYLGRWEEEALTNVFLTEHTDTMNREANGQIEVKHLRPLKSEENALSTFCASPTTAQT